MAIPSLGDMLPSCCYTTFSFAERIKLDWQADSVVKSRFIRNQSIHTVNGHLSKAITLCNCFFTSESSIEVKCCLLPDYNPGRYRGSPFTICLQLPNSLYRMYKLTELINSATTALLNSINLITVGFSVLKKWTWERVVPGFRGSAYHLIPLQAAHMDDDTRQLAWPVKKFHSLTHLFCDSEWLNHGSGFDVVCRDAVHLLGSSDPFCQESCWDGD